MGKTRPPYPPEFRRRMVELVRSGRSPEQLDQSDCSRIDTISEDRQSGPFLG